MLTIFRVNQVVLNYAGEKIVTAQEEKHPADEIGKALSRAGGILSSLSNCYDKNDSDFQISVPFMFEAVSAVEKLLGHASEELTKLYHSYDLAKLSSNVTPSAIEIELEENAGLTDGELHNNEAQEEADQPLSFQRHTEAVSVDITNEEPPYLGFFGPTEQVSRLASRVDRILGSMPQRPPQVETNELRDRPAVTYNELLEKLTAMADAAAYQSHQTPGLNQNLLPVLEALRSDVMRIRTA